MYATYDTGNAGSKHGSSMFTLLQFLGELPKLRRTYGRELEEYRSESNFGRLQLFSLIILFAVANAYVFMSFPTPQSRALFLVMGGISAATLAGSLLVGRRSTRGSTLLKRVLIYFVILVYILWVTLQLYYGGGDVRSFVTYAVGIMVIPAVFSLGPLFFLLLGVVEAGGLFLLPYAAAALTPALVLDYLPLLLNIIVLGVLIAGLHYLIFVKLFLIQKAREEKERKTELALRGGNLGYWNWDLENETIEVDGRWLEMLGYPEEPGVITFERFFRMIHPHDRSKVAQALQKYLDGEAQAYRLSFRISGSDGSYRWVYSEGSITQYGADGSARTMHGIHQNIQQFRSQQLQLAESEARFKAYTENAPVGVCIVEHGSFQYVNPETVRIVGYTEQELLTKVGLLQLVHPEDRHKVIAELKYLRRQRKVKGEYLFRIISRSGEIHWIESRVSVLDWHHMRLLLSAVDVTEREAAQEKLQEYATYDDLTGTFNRRVGLSLLEQEMKRAEREETPVSACFLDINGLKRVNDIYGHGKGDELILEVVQGVKEAMRRNDVVCRLGGDEFLIVFPRCDAYNAEKAWGRIAERYERMNRLSGRSYTISVSHGITEYRGVESVTTDELLKKADSDMYREKHRSRDTGEV